MNHWITTEDFIKYKPVSNFSEGGENQASLDARLENSHTLFRKKFVLGKVEGQSYRLSITADDYYKLYINGMLFAMGPANGYHDRYYYNEYDVTKVLREGENLIAVHVYYHGRIDYAHVSADNRQGMWARLCADGDCVWETDSSWKYWVDKSYISNGVTWGYDTQFAENIDRRLHPVGWEKVEFDDNLWLPCVVNETDDHVLVRQITPSVDFYEVEPKEITKCSDNNYILDFGKEIVGYVRLRIKSERGGHVRIKCGEELLETGHVRSKMRCGVEFDEVWTYGAGEDLIESFEYSGFRYLEFEAKDESVLPEDFSVLVRHYPIRQKREFNGENKTIQRIWDICENAVIMSTQEGFFDCPTREKGQYLGDMLITGLSHFCISGDARLYQKGVLDFAHSVSVCEGMAGVAPAAIMNPIADYSLLYPLIVWNYYQISKDWQLVIELIPVMEQLISYYEKYQREDGLLEGVREWNLVDWPQGLRDGYEFDLSKPTKPGVHNVMNAYYYGARKTMNQLYQIAGIDKYYDTKRMKEAFFAAFYQKDTGLFTDCEHGTHSALHSNVLPYYFDMAEEVQQGKIVDFIMEKGFSCGVYFAYFVLMSLVKHGEREKARKLLLNESEHSWCNMLEEGATSCFEAWGKEQKHNTSLCHPWASTPIILLSTNCVSMEEK